LLACKETGDPSKIIGVLLFDILHQFLFYSKVSELFPFAFIDLYWTTYASDGMDSSEAFHILYRLIFLSPPSSGFYREVFTKIGNHQKYLPAGR